MQLHMIKNAHSFLLAENGADITAKNNNNIPASIHAVLQKKVKVMKYLFEHGAEIANTEDINHSTSLMFSSNKGPLENVKMIVEAGAKINAVNDKKMSALLYACMEQHEDIIEYLHDHGADFKHASNAGNNAIIITATRKLMLMPKKQTETLLFILR